MPRKARSKDGAAVPTPTGAEAGEKTGERTKPKASRRRVKRQARVAARSAKTGRPKQLRKTVSRSRRGRVRYSDVERQKILETAKREGLTGNQVAKRFGISTVTYYLWRKKTGSTTRGRQGGRLSRSRLNLAEFSGQLREAVRVKVREMLPGIIEQEVAASLGGRSRRNR